MKYIVMPVIELRGYITYAVVDTTTQTTVRKYGCELWANHKAKEMNNKEHKDEE